MRKKLLYIGGIILLVGIILIVASLFITADSIKTYNSFSKYGNSTNEWLSTEINLSSQSQLITTGNSMYVINASFLPQVNQANAYQIGLKPNINESIGTGNVVSTYTVGPGSFYVIYFNATSQHYQFQITNNLNTVIVLGLFLIAGGIMVLAGIVVTIIGAILKPKNGSKNELDDVLYGEGDLNNLGNKK